MTHDHTVPPAPPQDRNAGGPPETATGFPARCRAPASVYPAGPNNSANAHSHASAELAAHAAAGVQGTLWLGQFICGAIHLTLNDLWKTVNPARGAVKHRLSSSPPTSNLGSLQEQSLLQPPTLQLLNGMGPLGRRASDGGANIQLHAQLLKRPRGPSPLVASPVRISIFLHACGIFSLLLVVTGG